MKSRRRKGDYVRRPAFIAAHASALLLFLAISLAGQERSPTPPPPIEPLERVLSELGNARIGNSNSKLPASTPVIRPLASLDDLKKDVERLQSLSDELQLAMRSSANQRIEQYASKIHELAKHLQTSLWLPPAESENAREKDAPVVSSDELRGLVSGLSESIKAFAGNPVIQQPRTVDAQLLEKAGLDLERIVRQSASLEMHAEELNIASPAVPARSASGGAAKKNTGAGPTYLQLRLDCGVWTVDSFADRAAKVENLWPQTIDGVKIQVRHHRLSTEQLVFIGECMVQVAGQKAAADNARYAAVIKDFNSYEVKGRTFAYQTTYEIVRTKGGKIGAHMTQRLFLYFTDEGGHGDFDLYLGKMPLRFLPDWVKDHATSP